MRARLATVLLYRPLAPRAVAVLWRVRAARDTDARAGERPLALAEHSIRLFVRAAVGAGWDGHRAGDLSNAYGGAACACDLGPCRCARKDEMRRDGRNTSVGSFSSSSLVEFFRVPVQPIDTVQLIMHGTELSRGVLHDGDALVLVALLFEEGAAGGTLDEAALDDEVQSGFLSSVILFYANLYSIYLKPEAFLIPVVPVLYEVFVLRN